MKVNSEKLWDYIFDLPSGKKVRFKVYHDDVYFTEILWNGIEFEWASGTFSSGAFFSPLYDFIPVEEEKEIEHYNLVDNYKNMSDKIIANNFEHINEELEWLVREIKKLKEQTK